MRFVVAALAAFLVLMLDLDGPSDQATIATSQLSYSPISQAFLNAISLNAMARFENAEASEEPSASPQDEPRDEAQQATEPEAGPAQASAQETFCHALREAAEASGIPVPFFARLLWQESRFRSNEVSHAGARGVAQFMPETAAEVGLDDPFDPMKALPASAKLLSKLRNDFGNLGLAAAAYNAGSGRIQKWLARQSELPRETRDYVRIITGTKAEDWTAESETLAIRVDLPRKAPCEGVGGLSKMRDVAFVPASITPSITAIIRKAEAMQLAARLTANRARKRLVLLLEKGKARSMIAARTAGKGTKSRPIHLASRARSSG